VAPRRPAEDAGLPTSLSRAGQREEVVGMVFSRGDAIDPGP
jgi:hypothetical protein